MSERAMQESNGELSEGEALGKYKVVRLIGAGAMGTVYEAAHAETGHRVAVKVLDPQLAAMPAARERFLLEARITNRVRHPHIVDVIEVGEGGGHTFMVMELLKGEDLAQRLERSGPIAFQDAVDILVPVCGAIAAAHQAGITHRDLKPHNIFLASAHGREQPKVLDFGIAISQGLSASTVSPSGKSKAAATLIGSPCYLAPEQVVSSHPSGPASDQYALGVIAYEILTGRRPFDGDNLNAVLQAIAAGGFEAPTALKPDVPPALEEVVLKTMSHEPSDRFESVTDLGRALLPFASGRLKLFWEGTFADRSRRSKRTPAAAAVTVADGSRWSSADLRNRINAPARRPSSPSSPAIVAEAATPSPYVKTLPPGEIELPEVTEPSLIPAYAIESPPEPDLDVATDDAVPGLTFKDRIAPFWSSKWARGGGIAIAIGCVALFIARGRASAPKPAAVMPGTAQVAAPAPEPVSPPAPEPTPAPAPAAEIAAKQEPAAAVEAAPKQEPAPVAEVAPKQELAAVTPAAAVKPEPAAAVEEPPAPAAMQEPAPVAEAAPPKSATATPHKTKPARTLARSSDKPKTAAQDMGQDAPLRVSPRDNLRPPKDSGAGRKRRVPLLD